MRAYNPHIHCDLGKYRPAGIAQRHLASETSAASRRREGRRLSLPWSSRMGVSAAKNAFSPRQNSRKAGTFVYFWPKKTPLQRPIVASFGLPSRHLSRSVRLYIGNDGRKACCEYGPSPAISPIWRTRAPRVPTVLPY